MSPAWEIACRAAREGAQQLFGQLGMVRSKLGSQGFPKVGNDELKQLLPLQAVLPATSLPHSGAWTVAAEHIWEALGGTGNVPGAARVMGIGMGQLCWGRKGSSRLREYFSDGSWVGDVAQALRKNQQLLSG